nr:MAG TPA: hypothetical protein [Caudoviricetes sp.]
MTQRKWQAYTKSPLLISILNTSKFYLPSL